MAKKIDVDKYVAGLFSRTEQYADKVRKHYATAVEELLKISKAKGLNADEIFSFSANKRMNQQATTVLRQLYSAVYNEIKEGVSAEWSYANKATDALITSIFGKGVIQDNHFAHWFGRNQKAMDAFFARKSADGGLNLSQRVWKYTDSLRDEMELALSLSMGEGVSASTVSRRVRQYLQEPNKLFRRIRTGTDADGNPLYKLSERAKNYSPGKGVYRSSYKNAMRLTRTETNMAYRAADYERWQALPFVIGVEINLSNNHNCIGVPKGRFNDICDDLKGVYPKDFKFVGWHPQCRCFSTPKLASVEEMMEYQEKVLNDEDVSNYRFRGEVKTMPKSFTSWWEDNKERVENANSVPYWLRDNKKVIDRKKKVKTEEEKKIIREKWENRAKEHAKTIGMANNVLKVAKDYGEINVVQLEKLLISKNIVELKKEATNVAKQVSVVKGQEQALSSLIPNAHQLHQTYSITNLQETYKELDGVMKRWLSKYNYSTIDNAPLEHLLNKLKFEMTNPTVRYSYKDIVNKALTEHIRIVEEKIQWNDLTAKVLSLKKFKTRSVTFKKSLSEIDDAIARNDVKALQNSVAKAETQYQKLIAVQSKFGVNNKTSLNSEFKGTATGKDLTAQIDVRSLKTTDSYIGKKRYTNQVARMQGFDSPAKLVSDSEFDMLEQAYGEVFYRTVNPTTFNGKNMSGKEFAQQLYIADKMDLNGGGGRYHGDGIYVATSSWDGHKNIPLSNTTKKSAYDESVAYGNGSYKTLEMTWLRKPNIIKATDLERMWDNLTDAQKMRYGNHMNTYACALGYDAMYCDGFNYVVIWNRSIIAVKNK